MKTMEKALALALILTVLFSFTGFAEQCEDIPNRVLRLHVLANSDSDEDQALKLKVRDRILSAGAGILDTAGSREEAEAIITQHLPQLQVAAEAEVKEQGYDYPVKVELTRMYFTTRQYDTVTLPAGEYSALRVSIGEAKGKNWWCVMFPPMCLPAAEESAELKEVLNPSQMEIVTGNSGGYEIKLKSVEIYEQIKSWLSGDC